MPISVNQLGQFNGEHFFYFYKNINPNHKLLGKGIIMKLSEVIMPGYIMKHPNSCINFINVIFKFSEVVFLLYLM